MTAVVGILNKKGIALAADSAVTRNRGFREKVTKNGNKLVILSNAIPVSVMFTGNGCFLNNPWDVVARRYRQERGNIPHATVENCMQDFFEYVSNNNVFWNKNVCNNWIENILEKLLQNVNVEIPYDIDIRKKDGSFAKPALYKKHLLAY